MYPSKGSNVYGQQSYAAQQAYGHMSGGGYPGNQIGTPEGNSQHALASCQTAMLGSSQEVDIGGYRAHTSQVPHYGGAYASVYGSSTLGSGQQAAGLSGKGTGSSLQGRQAYAHSGFPESSKFGCGAVSGSLGMKSEDYIASGYAHKVDQYPVERRHYDDNQNAYIGRDEPGRRLPDPGAVGYHSQSELRDHVDQASLVRQQQMLKVQSLQPGSDTRQAEYMAARSAAIHHGHQDISTYGGRMDADPRNMPILGSAPYAGQHPASILGGPSRGNVDHVYAHGSSVAGYGVGLPPGRDYAAGKGIHGASHESNYQGSALLQGGFSSAGVRFVDERKDDRSSFHRELDLREEERRRELLREREKERERELEREQEREREHEKDRECLRERERLKERERERKREREREHERKREREREREREWERERLLKRREKERERERKCVPEHKQERTPPGSSNDRQVSSATKDGRPLRGSPRCDTSHRLHSPVKEKRREYICKVSPFSFVDRERDYTSLHKRYPKLSISPEFSKVVLNWPKGKLNMSLHTPVSFEHDVVEGDTEQKGSQHLMEETGKSQSDSTVWNAKVILMSGISSDALEELCTEKSSDDRIPHINNILKFAILRKDRSFMAIGGPWNVSIDGGDPSTDDSSMVQTAKRYLKDLTQLDLLNCQHWNHFLEIHYDRIGKDGLFSHKEITIIYLPNLSNCLPALDLWRNQWLAHKKMATENEQLAHTQKKKSSEKDSLQGDYKPSIAEKADDDAKDVKIKVEDGIEKQDLKGPPIEMVADVEKVENMKDMIESKENVTGLSVTDDKQLIKTGEVENVKETTSGMANVQGGVSVPATTVKEPAKRRVVKKAVKGKTVVNKVMVEEMVPKDAEKKVEKNVDEKQCKTEDMVQPDEISPANVKMFVRKKIIKKAPTKAAQNEDKALETSDVQTEKVSGKETVAKANDNGEQAGTSVKEATPKVTVRKKIIKRVIRKKIMKVEDKGESADGKQVGGNDPDATTGAENVKTEVRIADDSANVANKLEDKPTNESKEVGVVKQDGDAKTDEGVRKEDEKKARSDANSKGGDNMLGDAVETEAAKHQDSKKGDENCKKEQVKDEKKADPKLKSSKGSKEKKPEAPPKYPGLFLQTKQSKDCKIRSVSLSLDGLLDYTEKDIEESTFELSLFAELLSEMLQFEMGCRLLSFLQKLHIKFVAKRNQQKRERDENAVKNEKDSSSKKRPKLGGDDKVENEPAKSVTQGVSAIDSATETDKDNSASGMEESKAENKIEGNLEEEFEDPEELSDYDEEMDDASPNNVAAEELQEETTDSKVESGAKTKKAPVQERKEEDADKKSGDDISKVDEKHDRQKNAGKETDLGGKVNTDKEVVDKELLQAFRYFDRNQAGYIKVEDLRLIIHNLGMFLSHRDVKELVQSALLESNSGRDNRIMYSKLVRMSV